MNAPLPTTPAPNAPVPIVAPASLRRLPLWAAGSVVIVGAVSVIAALAFGDRSWWPALTAAAIIAALSAVASVLVLRQAAGRAVDWLVTLTMGATVARMGVTGIGLLLTIKLTHVRADVAGLSLCGYYAAMLVAETALLTRVARPSSDAAADSVGGSNV